MTVGTKSLLFGVHQFIWHPVTVFLAWYEMYGCPSLNELIAIIIHDWGYWGCRTMDGEDGNKHPKKIATALYNKYTVNLLGLSRLAEISTLVLLHSRHTARDLGAKPSKVCWADKLSIIYDPNLFILFRAWLSGELYEYRELADKSGFVSIKESHRFWLKALKKRHTKLAICESGDAEPYLH